jgi:hypothetical protein
MNAENPAQVATGEPPSKPHSSMDDVIDAYKKDVDRTLLRENLRLTPTERIEKFEKFGEFAVGLYDSGRRHRGEI